MKQNITKYLQRLLVFLCLFIYSTQADATEYGKNKSAVDYRYQVQKGKSVKVRSLPNTSTGNRLFSVEYPDYIYVDDMKVVDDSGHKWISISGNEGYISTSFLTRVDNPHFVQAPIAPSAPIDIERAHTITKWVLLAVAVACLIFILILCIEPIEEKGRDFFIGVPNKHNMRRFFYFNPEPYGVVLGLSACILLSIVVSVLLLLLVGGAVFVLFWVIKILLFILIWVGIIGCILGVIACLCKAWEGAIFAVIGGIIWAFSDAITRFGEALVEAGLSFFHELNMLSFAGDLFSSYWKEGLGIALTPMALFLALAFISILFAGIFMLIEWVVTQRYNIKHPCPLCHQASEPAIYLSQGNPLEVNLHPGVYGLFSIKHPVTGEKMPTMLFNGRDNLTRQCHHCHKPINAKVGEEKHIAMVGLPQAGKTTLIYRIIAEMMRKFGKEKVEFTDSVDFTAQQFIKSVASTGKLHNYPPKTGTGRHRSIQLLIHRPGLSLPYRLFINDVAGEQFTINKDKQDAVSFLSHIQSIIFLIDPFTADFTGLSLSSSFKKWYQDKVGTMNQGADMKLAGALDTLKNMLESQANKTSNVHFNFVFVKKDTGYLDGIDKQSEAALKGFLEDSLDMGNYINNIQKGYASTQYFAVSAIEDLEDSNVGLLSNSVFEQIGLKVL